jgi:hypothetical protein
MCDTEFDFLYKLESHVITHHMSKCD